MDRIETSNGTMHTMRERIDFAADRDGNRRGVSSCGRLVKGRTGQCVATMINCRNCCRILRADGYRV